MRSLAFVALLGAACAGSNAATKCGGKPLYDRLGGQGAITAVVESFHKRLSADARINARFANTDAAHLKAMLVEQICQASGGPCKYSGKDMKTAHAGMKITDEEFDALVADLKGALDEFKVGAAEQQELLGVLGPMRPDIVGQ
jgi:hemoglobin